MNRTDVEKRIQQFLDTNAEKIVEEKKEELPPLIYSAVRHNMEQYIEPLVKKGENINGSENLTYFTPLQYAVMFSSTNMVTTLMENKADPYFTPHYKITHNVPTPLRASLGNYYDNMLKTLLECGADPDIPLVDCDGKSIIEVIKVRKDDKSLGIVYSHKHKLFMKLCMPFLIGVRHADTNELGKLCGHRLFDKNLIRFILGFLSPKR